MIQLFSAIVAMFTEASRNRVDVEIQFRKSNADRVTSPCGGGRVRLRVCYFTESTKKIVSFKRFLCAKGLSMLMVYDKSIDSERCPGCMKSALACLHSRDSAFSGSLYLLS